MGFAAEIKEFIGAAKDSWKLKSDSDLKDAQALYQSTLAKKTQADIDNPLNDEEQKAKIENLRARTASHNASTALMHAGQQPAVSGPAMTAAPVARAALVPAGARPSSEPEETGTNYARGGLVKKYAVGGPVEDDSEDDEGMLPRR